MKIRTGILANGYSQAINIVIQFATVPVLLTHWGLEQYGQWLMLTSIQAYLSFSDLGILVASMNKCGQLAAANKKESAQRLHSSTYLYAILSGLLTITVCSAIVAILFKRSIIDINVTVAALALIIYSQVAQLSTLIDSTFRANNRYAEGLFSLESIRLVEWAALAMTASLGYGVQWAALSMLSVRVSLSTVLLYIIGRRFEYCLPSIRGSFLGEIKPLYKGALGWMGFRLNDALTIQGTTLLLGTIFTPSIAAIYAAHRTLARASVQLASMIPNSAWPEFVKLHGQQDRERFHKLMNQTQSQTISFSAASSLTILLCGSLILPAWTNGAIESDFSLLGVLCISSLLGSAIYCNRIVLASVNGLAALALKYLACTTAFLLVASQLGAYGVTVIGTCLMLAEAVNYLISRHEILRQHIV